MSEVRKDSSGRNNFISSPEEILRTLSALTGISENEIVIAEEKDPSSAREIAMLLMCQGLGMSFQSTGRSLKGITAPAVRNRVNRGARRLTRDADFAHTFAVAEQRSNFAKKGG